MLVENAVVDICCKFLKGRGFEIESRAYVGEKGVDIVARRHDFRIFVEAKGEGSGVKTSARYGKHFTANQVFDVVSKVIFKALANKQDPQFRDGDLIGIALPDRPLFREWHQKVAVSLNQLRLITFWVTDQEGGGTVDVEHKNYSYASVWFPSECAFLVDSAPHPFPVSEAIRREKEGFKIYPQKNWLEDQIPFLTRSIDIGIGSKRQYSINLDTDLLAPVLDGIKEFERIRLLTEGD
jgi:hypothetical protein